MGHNGKKQSKKRSDSLTTENIRQPTDTEKQSINHEIHACPPLEGNIRKEDQIYSSLC